MKKSSSMIILLILLFLIFTEKLTILNFIISILVGFIVYFMNKSEIETMGNFNLRKIPLWFMYIVVLFKEVVFANIQVAIITLSPKMNISPRIIKHKSKLKKSMLLTIYSNSITLTPGTMTVSIEGNVLDIHCLNEKYEMGLKDNIMEKILLRIEGEVDE